MGSKLNEIKIAVLATNGFEESELSEPVKALKEEGATVHIVAPDSGKIKGWKSGNWSKEYEVDQTLGQANPDNYDALVLPGGVINPDKLRREEKAIKFVKAFFDKNKPVAAICHGPQLLIDAEVVKSRKMTSFKSIRKDLQNAGANWVDQEVVTDQGLTTSRNPDDLPAFNKRIIEEFAAVHA